MLNSDAPTMPSSKAPCDHRDMAGDSLIESKGDDHWCAACGSHWTMKPHDVVIVNDETLDTRAA